MVLIPLQGACYVLPRPVVSVKPPDHYIGIQLQPHACTLYGISYEHNSNGTLLLGPLSRDLGPGLTGTVCRKQRKLVHTYKGVMQVC